MLAPIFILILSLSPPVSATAPSSKDLLNPSLFTCPCDLTEACDLNCCCDTSCSDSDKLLFSPACQTPVRPFINADIDASFCNDLFGNPRLHELNWFPFVCVNSATTVLLGKFYSPYDLASFASSDKFLPKIEQKIRESYNYRSTFINNIQDSESLIRKSEFCSLNSVKQYNYGTCLKLTDTVSDTLASRFFTFPNPLSGLSSTCSYNTPVRYLINQPRFPCPILIDAQMEFCTSSKLNYSSYISTMHLIKNPKATAKTSVSLEFWKCTPYIPASDFVPNANLNPQPCLAPDTVSSCIFSQNAQIFDTLTSGLCASSTWKYSANRINDIPLDFNSKLFSKCAKIDMANWPSVAGNVCQDVVVSVKNLFIWSAGSVNRVISQIVLADVAFNPSSVSPTQKFNQLFEVKWLYDTIPVSSIGEYNIFIESADYVKSLKTSLRGVQKLNITNSVSGYIDGNIIISGYRPDGADTATPVDIAYSQRISAYKILNGKLCGQLSNLERVQIRFNQNLSSTCVVRLTTQDLSNRCNCLKNLIFNKLNDYFAPSNYVSKNGAPDMGKFTASDWLSVFPVQRMFENTVDKDLNGTDLKGFCSNVPYKISINFLYAKVGKASGIDFNEIIGTQISYSYRDWRFFCKLENKRKCTQDGITQDFEIEFEVKFSNTTYKSQTLSFIEKCNADHSYSMGCIQQVFFLWPQDYRDPNFFYLYTVQLSIVFGAFSVGLIYLMVFGMVCPC